MGKWLQLLLRNWNEALADRKFAWRLAATFTIYSFVYLLLARFLLYNKSHPGYILYDPIMSFFVARDFSLAIFLFTYLGILSFFYCFLPHPRMILPIARAFLILFALRVCFIYLIPLEPPPAMIVLNDPFIDRVIGFHQQVSNDLFFSGHVADLAFFIFCCSHKVIRKFLIVAVILAAVMLVWQKVHYTADVIAAPFFSYFCYTVFVKQRMKKYMRSPAARL